MTKKVLSIGSDRNLFVSGSEAQKRIKEYGKLFDGLHIIVFADESLGFKNIELENNVFIYPTNHKYKATYLWSVYKAAKDIFSENHPLKAGGWVVTAQDPSESALAGWLLKLRYKLPLQIQVHTDIFSPYFWQESLLNKIRVLMAKFLLPRADGIRVVSQRIKDSLVYNLKLKTDNVSVSPIFVDVKKIQSAKVKMDLHKKYPEYDFIILMASRLTKEKNIGMAIEAMKEILSPKTHNLKPLLLIVGDGPELESYKSLVKSYKLENNVKFEGWSDNLTSYYKTADLFLLTSNYEGYGRTVIEAMAAGCPVVMTDVGLAGELLVDELDGLVVPVGDKITLTKAIQELIENKEKRNSLITESQKIINSLPEKKEYLENYKNLLIL